MTPQLQQAIKLLQMSSVELEDFIAQELDSNPLLTQNDGALDDDPDGDDISGTEPRPDSDGDPEDRSDGDEIGASVERDGGTPTSETMDEMLGVAMAENLPQLHDTDNDNLWNGDADFVSRSGPLGASGGSTSGAAGARHDFTEADLDVASTLANEVSLRDVLATQIAVEFLDPTDRIIALRLVDHLDPSGYLIGDLGKIALTLGCPRDRLEKVVTRLQSLDPPGVFARNLQECLEIQLRDANRLDPAMACLLENLELLARGELVKLQKMCGVDHEDMQGMIAEIRALEPRPAAPFDTLTLQPLVPDVLMRPLPDSGSSGGWAVEMSTEALPRVLVNRSYYAMVKAAVRTKAELLFLTENLRSANWLVKALDQRATTILRVATEIVRQQHEFFLHGVQQLRPLVLRDVASEIDMHESTVSRATTNKYIATPRGIFELKYFFSSAIADSAGGSAHSAETVRQRIKALVDAEPAGRILSDDGIVTILRREGYGIARRTVAKYRESMRIPSSVERRRQKSLTNSLTGTSGP